MSAANTDKLMKVGNPGTVTQLGSPGKALAASSINVGSTTNYPSDTGFIVAIRQVDSNGDLVPNTYTEWAAIVSGPTSIAINNVPVYGTDQVYTAGVTTQVYIPVSAERENRLIAALLQDHGQSGQHKTLYDDNLNEWLERGQVASAVNQVKITNAITAGFPRIDASGGDTNIDLKAFGKGTGRFYADHLPPQIFADEAFLDFVASGGVWSGDAYASTRNASMTALVAYINGRRISIAAVTARAFTASKDTYVDILDNADGTGTLVYTEVTNNAASPALAANSLRIAIIVTGASNIASVGSINQGQEGKLLPISTYAYQITDSLGNRICRRKPSETRIGAMRKLDADSFPGTSYGTYFQIVGETRGGDVVIEFEPIIRNGGSGASRTYDIQILCDGVTTGIVPTAISGMTAIYAGAEYPYYSQRYVFVHTPAAGKHTWAVQLKASSGSAVGLITNSRTVVREES